MYVIPAPSKHQPLFAKNQNNNFRLTLTTKEGMNELNIGWDRGTDKAEDISEYSLPLEYS